MDNGTIKEEKKFQASLSNLYKAWTEEEALKVWWQPGGRKLSSVEAELEEGGELVYSFEEAENENGNLSIEGKYETVEPEAKLVYTWDWKLDNAPVENGEYKLTVEFSGDESSSTLTVTQESNGDHLAIHPSEAGWRDALNDLETYLADKQQSE